MCLTARFAQALFEVGPNGSSLLRRKRKNNEHVADLTHAVTNSARQGSNQKWDLYQIAVLVLDAQGFSPQTTKLETMTQARNKKCFIG